MDSTVEQSREDGDWGETGETGETGRGADDPAVPALRLWFWLLLGVPGCSSGFDGFGFVISYREGRERVMS